MGSIRRSQWEHFTNRKHAMASQTSKSKELHEDDMSDFEDDITSLAGDEEGEFISRLRRQRWETQEYANQVVKTKQDFLRKQEENKDVTQRHFRRAIQRHAAGMATQRPTPSSYAEP